MRPLAEMPEAVARGIRLVLTDIDDTLTTDGRLPADAYLALERLKTAGLAVAAVTGRPAGWCDMVARFWPVDGVVGENGALYFAYDASQRRMIRSYAVDEAARAAAQIGLARIRDRVLAEVPGAAIASDQFARLVDLAIDFCEDVPALTEAQIARIKEIFEEEGAVAKISSIHVNGWFGSHDKLTMTRRFAAEILGLDIDTDRDAVVYCGDSPNDAPMFAHFPHGCGVANIRDFEGRIEALPGWIAPSRGGAGFVEIAERLLAAHRGADAKNT
ncbi:MAG: HAD-IIB family hydrolase [Pseudomonadota bacterium]